MKNIHILPTDKPSQLYNYIERTDKFFLDLKRERIPVSTVIHQNIYITSDEEIKEGDWCLFNQLEIVKCTYSKNGEYLFSSPLKSSSNHHFSYFKKIILTTDQDLIKGGVQGIDDDFLEWFVNNPSCEKIEIDWIWKKYYEDDLNGREMELVKKQYKIIIPKEESKQEMFDCEYCGGTGVYITLDSERVECPACEKGKVNFKQEMEILEVPMPIYKQETLEKKEFNQEFEEDIHIPLKPKKIIHLKAYCEIKQETIEEAAERMVKEHPDFESEGFSDYQNGRFNGIIEGAKWQQERSYSEEDMKLAFDAGVNYMKDGDLNKKDWFEQFKKK